MAVEKQMLALLVASVLSAVIYFQYQRVDLDFNQVASSTSLGYQVEDSVSTSFQLEAESSFGPPKTDSQEKTNILTYTSVFSEDDNSYVNDQSSIEIETSFVELTQDQLTRTTSSIETEIVIPFYSVSPKSSEVESSHVVLPKSTSTNNLVDSPIDEQICYNDAFRNNVQKCRPRCKLGSDSFSLDGMTSCRPVLTCEEIEKEVVSVKKIDNGTVKNVFLGSWKNHQVAILTLRDQKYSEDFLSGLQTLRSFSGSDNIIQLIGYCVKTTTYITEYHQFGNILNFFKLLQTDINLQQHDKISLRFGLCVDYVKSIEFLHNSPIGITVMCDANELGKIFHQYLITNNLSLILNDLDAIPVVNKSVVCGKLRLTGSLLAPEQINEDYDEKIDVWRIPDVCEYFLGNDAQSEVVRYHLFNVHNKCKNRDPSLRPTAKDVVRFYDQLARTILS